MLERPIVRIPEFVGGTWLNREQPLRRQDLLGQVVLIDFWEYSCVNCIRTLPYLKAWHERYAELGLTVIGVHTPEFHFGRVTEQVAAAVNEFELPYPILLDNQYQNWERYAVKAWPTKILVDPAGYIRMRRQGEGYYREIEQGIQLLLKQRDESVFLPDLLPPLRPEDEPGAVCYRPTPELYAGYQGGGLFGGALGNPEGYVSGAPMVYVLPPDKEREKEQFYLEGFWKAEPEAMVYAGQDGGRVLLSYRAAQVNAVLSPSIDSVELILGLRHSESDPMVEVRLEGRPVPEWLAGRDIEYDEDGRSYVRVERSQLFHLIDDDTFAERQLELVFRAPGIALYSFAFSGCVVKRGLRNDFDTYRVS